MTARSLNNGSVTSVQLVSEYVARIEANNFKGYELRAVIEVAPLSILLSQALKADALRKSGTNLGYLHGVGHWSKHSQDALLTTHNIRYQYSSRTMSRQISLKD